ncbi:hypothetical protein GQ85_06400 [Rhodococcus rhodochrous]|nr:hypothetical protein GQ85_06400 [Rhodococcus rhodochrous]
MTENVYVRIAGTVLNEAAAIDHRIRKNITTTKQLQDQIAAWGRVFEKNGKVWPLEALDAVAEHYAKPDAFPIMPGDVIAYCNRQPVTSSPEHVSWFLDVWAQHPWSTAIEQLVGRDVPELSADSYEVADKQRLVELRRQYISEHRSELIGEAVERANRRAIGR